MKILMGTKNPGKIEGAKRAFERYFDDVEIEGVSVNSDVPEQPFNTELYEGASNRVKNLRKYAEENNIKADFFVASEGGITEGLGTIIEFNIAVVEDAAGYKSTGASPGFPVPERYIPEIKEKDLGQLMDRLFDGDKLSKGKGGIGMLTKDQLTRIDMTEQAFIMALTSHINGDLWK